MSHNVTRDQRRVGLGLIADRNGKRQRLQPTLLAPEEPTLQSTFPVTNNTVDDVNTTGTLRGWPQR
jgi:hypothetical protein